MTENLLPPFSARNRGAHSQIDNDFPESARIGLLHLLHRLVDDHYVQGWNAVIGELERIARVKPSDSRDELDAERLLLELPWEKVFDFCERLYGHLAQDCSEYNGESEHWEVVTPKAEVQKVTGAELQRLFLEEHFALEFSGGIVRRRGRRHTTEQISRAELVLGDPRLATALSHFNKALRYFGNVSQPDPENVVKEAVCAVEASARALFPDGGPTLGKVIKSITGRDSGQLPKAIADTFQGLYGFRSSGEGVGHGGAEGGPVTRELAEYVLAVSASQIVLLVDLARSLEPDIPF